MAADLQTLFSVNRTMFPRNSSWTTMVASAQLTDLDDPVLVSQLANLYENLNVRLEYNGRLYDDWVTDVARSSVPASWDRVTSSLTISTRRDVNRFRSDLRGTRDLTGMFIGLLEAWAGELDVVIDEVDAHLGRRGGGA
jgi:hypothetical protein